MTINFPNAPGTYSYPFVIPVSIIVQGGSSIPILVGHKYLAFNFSHVGSNNEIVNSEFTGQTFTYTDADVDISVTGDCPSYTGVAAANNATLSPFSCTAVVTVKRQLTGTINSATLHVQALTNINNGYLGPSEGIDFHSGFVSSCINQVSGFP